MRSSFKRSYPRSSGYRSSYRPKYQSYGAQGGYHPDSDFRVGGKSFRDNKYTSYKGQIYHGNPANVEANHSIVYNPQDEKAWMDKLVTEGKLMKPCIAIDQIERGTYPLAEQVTGDWIPVANETLQNWINRIIPHLEDLISQYLGENEMVTAIHLEFHDQGAIDNGLRMNIYDFHESAALTEKIHTEFSKITFVRQMDDLDYDVLIDDAYSTLNRLGFPSGEDVLRWDNRNRLNTFSIPIPYTNPVFDVSYQSIKSTPTLIPVIPDEKQIKQPNGYGQAPPGTVFRNPVNA